MVYSKRKRANSQNPLLYARPLPWNYTLTAEIAKIDRKIQRISAAIEDSDDVPTTLVKRLSELEKERAELEKSVRSSSYDPSSADRILDECDRLRLSILEVLNNEKSTMDALRNALSLFIHSVVIYPDKRVLLRYTLPGFAKVAGTTSGLVRAPLTGLEPATCGLEDRRSVH